MFEFSPQFSIQWVVNISANRDIPVQGWSKSVTPMFFLLTILFPLSVYAWYDIFYTTLSDWFIISQLLCSKSSGRTWYHATQRDMSGQLLNMDNKNEHIHQEVYNSLHTCRVVLCQFNSDREYQNQIFWISRFFCDGIVLGLGCQVWGLRYSRYFRFLHSIETENKPKAHF